MKAEENIVIIRRKVAKNLNKSLKTLQDLSVKYMGSAAFKGTTLPVTGLTPVEKYAILPSLVQLNADHNEFDLAVNNYYHDLRVEIPAGKGLKLDISTEDVEITYANKKHVVAMPKKPLDYILYKRAISPDYVQCAKTPTEAQVSGDRVKFFIHNLKDAQDAEVKLGNARDKAFAAYLKLKEDAGRWDDVLVVYGINPNMISQTEKGMKLRSIAEATDVIASEKLDAYKKFTDLVDDEDLDTKALLAKLLKSKQIIISGKSYIYDNGAASETLGTTEREAIVWLQDPNNGKAVMVMEGKLS